MQMPFRSAGLADPSPANEASPFPLERDVGAGQTGFQAPTTSIINSDG